MDYLTFGQYTILVTGIAFFVALFYSDWRNKQGDAVTQKLVDRVFWLYLLSFIGVDTTYTARRQGGG